MGVIGLMNLGEVVDDRLPVVLVAARTWWTEVGVPQGGRRGEGVVLFSRGEKVEVSGENEEAVCGIRIHVTGVFQDGVLNSEYLRRRETKIMDIPMNPAESPMVSRDTQYSSRDEMVLIEDSLGACSRTRYKRH